METAFPVCPFTTPQHLVENVLNDCNYHQLRPKSLLVSFSVFLMYIERFQNESETLKNFNFM